MAALNILLSEEGFVKTITTEIVNLNIKNKGLNFNDPNIRRTRYESRQQARY